MEIKKKTKIGIIIATVLVLLIVVGVILYFTLASSTPEKSVEELFSALKAGDFSKATTYVQKENGQDSELANIVKAEGQEENADTQKTKLFFELLDWKIKKTDKQGDTANVEVEVTTKNISKVFSNYMQKVVQIALSGQEIKEGDTDRYLVEELQNTKETVTNTKTIQLKKEEGKWKVAIDDNLMNAVLPGLSDILNSMNNM